MDRLTDHCRPPSIDPAEFARPPSIDPAEFARTPSIDPAEFARTPSIDPAEFAMVSPSAGRAPKTTQGVRCDLAGSLVIDDGGAKSTDPGHHEYMQHGQDHDHRAHDDFGHRHFDDRAATWDENPSHVHRAEVIAEAVAAAVPLGATTRMLDYGAGTGLVAQALRDRVGPLTLADTSEGMRSVIQSKIESGVLGEATVWDVDLAIDAPPPGAQFDLIVTVMTLHHVADLAPVLAAFAALIAPGGHLCIADLEEEDGSFHGDGFHGHHGFARASLTAALTDAGFGEPTYSVPYHVDRDGRDYPVFLAVSAR